MAYFLWDNEGVLDLMEEFENDLTTDFIEVFSPVEKVDIFRIVACKWFGGIVSPSSSTTPIYRLNVANYTSVW